MSARRVVCALLLIAVMQRSDATPGMLTFDFNNNQQLLAIYTQIKDTYKATVDMLNKMDEVSTTIKRAQEGYQSLQNFDLQRAIQSTGFSGGVNNASTLDKSRAMRQELERMTGSVTGNTMYVQHQLKNIGELERLALIGDANKKNTEEAAKGLNAGKSAAVTAQSSALMATLAAEAAADRKEQQIQRQMDAQSEVDNLKQIPHVYEAFK